MTYNKEKHIELLKYLIEFEKQSKNIYDFSLERRDEYSKLSRYQCMVNDYFFFGYTKKNLFYVWRIKFRIPLILRTSNLLSQNYGRSL